MRRQRQMVVGRDRFEMPLIEMDTHAFQALSLLLSLSRYYTATLTITEQKQSAQDVCRAILDLR